jgi:SNF2 family DNA or RNA helicase
VRFEPHDYQREALAFLLERESAGLLADPGLGKTAVALALARALLLSEQASKILIVAPLRVAVSVWPAEARKWEQFADLKLQVVHGKNKTPDLSNDLFVINPEGLPALFKQRDSRKLDVLVIDESSKFKNWTAKRTCMIKKRLGQFRRRYIMSGTPSPNSLIDLFAQVYLLDRGAAWGKASIAWRERYFYPTDHQRRKWEPKPETADHIESVLAPLALRLDSDELLDLPPMIVNRVNVELPPAARKTYDTMQNMLFAELDGGADLKVASSAAVAYGMCRQIASGSFYRDDPDTPDAERVVERVHDAKIDAVAEIVGELQGKPVLVAYNYRHELKALRKRFGAETPYLAGGVSAKLGAVIVQAWNADELPILLVNPASVSHGLNLQYGSGRHIIWLTLTDNPENYEQLNKRILRQGVVGSVFVHHIIAKDTVDDAILGALRSKHATQKRLLDALHEYRKGKA